MGLADYLDRAPNGAESNRLIQQGGQQMADMPMNEAQLQGQKLRNAGQQQANTDAAYTAPGAPASPERIKMVDYIKAHMRTTPGHNPEFEAKLLAELQGGTPQAGGLGGMGSSLLSGAAAPPGGPGPVAGPQAPVQNMGQPGPYSGYTPPGQGQGLSQGMPQVSVSRQPMSMNGEPMRPPLVAPPQAPAGPSIPRAQVSVAQAPTAPAAPSYQMTNHDADSYARMAPFMKLDQPTKDDPRRDIAANALTFKREALQQRESSQARADQTKRDLAVIMARLREKLGDTDRKALIEQAKIVAGNYRAELSAIARRESGIPGIVFDEETKAGITQDATQAKAGLGKLDELERVLNAQGPGQSVFRSADVKGPRNAGGDISTKYKPGQVVGNKKMTGYNQVTKKWDWEPAP